MDEETKLILIRAARPVLSHWTFAPYEVCLSACKTTTTATTTTALLVRCVLHEAGDSRFLKNAVCPAGVIDQYSCSPVVSTNLTERNTGGRTRLNSPAPQGHILIAGDIFSNVVLLGWLPSFLIPDP
ncbi:predicted protein [Botrytis cinerea T4]|uniref:Uncharacterized protein n=1 Tax=Botryotinia fuckeliana (strain T4) TaxID=999810 RepID=G2YKY6_BOTF4|nr:predicted protein [Botrytis cinerea T4]